MVELLTLDPLAQPNQRVLVQRGDLDEAVEHYRQALGLGLADSEIHFSLGDALARKGKLDEAVKHFRQALRIRPEFAEAHESLGRALARQGKRDEAAQHYQEALRIMRSGSAGGVPTK